MRTLDVRSGVFAPSRAPPATRDHWSLFRGPKNQCSQKRGSGHCVPAALGHHLCRAQCSFSSLAPARGSFGGRFSDMLGADGVCFGGRTNFVQRWTCRRAPTRPRTRFYGRSPSGPPARRRVSGTRHAPRQPSTPLRSVRDVPRRRRGSARVRARRGPRALRPSSGRGAGRRFPRRGALRADCLRCCGSAMALGARRGRLLSSSTRAS